MPIAVWDTRYETGLDIIDAQHQALFGALNALAESFKAGNSNAKVEEVLDFLVDYSLDHFGTEEGLMWDADYSGLRAHRAQHAVFIERTRDLRDRLAQGERISIEVAMFLSTWLKDHIADVDFQMVRFLNSQREG